MAANDSWAGKHNEPPGTATHCGSGRRLSRWAPWYRWPWLGAGAADPAEGPLHKA
jgi:hypothetical protein